MATNVWAITTATVVNGTRTPNSKSTNWPAKPLRPNRYSSASPPTTGGSTKGRSTIARSTRMPGTCARASTTASGPPSRRHNRVDAAAVRSDSSSAASCRRRGHQLGEPPQVGAGDEPDDRQDDQRERQARREPQEHRHRGARPPPVNGLPARPTVHRRWPPGLRPPYSSLWASADGLGRSGSCLCTTRPLWTTPPESILRAESCRGSPVAWFEGAGGHARTPVTAPRSRPSSAPPPPPPRAPARRTPSPGRAAARPPARRSGRS